MLVLLLLPLIAAYSGPARADEATDAANTAVDIFVQSGKLVGLPITDQEATVVKQIVACGISGSNVGTCVKDAAVATALQAAGISDPAIADAATCLANSGSAATCAAKAATAIATLPPDAQPAMTCVLQGGSAADCGAKLVEGAVIDKVPADIQPGVTCMIKGGTAAACAASVVASVVVKNLDLPSDQQAQMTAVVNCLGQDDIKGCMVNAAVSGLTGSSKAGELAACATQGTPGAVGQCVANFAAQNLPPMPGGTDAVVKAVIGCVGGGTADFAKCAEQQAIAGAANVAGNALTPAAVAAIQTALTTAQTLADKLKPDADPTQDAGVNKDNIADLKNIIDLADGIKTKNWAEVTTAAGPELMIAASDVLLSIFVSPEVASALSPAVSAMINNDAAAVQLGLQAIGKGDPVGFAQVLFTWYETSFIDEPCALIPSGKVHDAICGGLADAIQFISNAGGDLAKALLNAGKDVLQWLGVWGITDSVATDAFNTVKNAIEDIGHVFGIGSDGDDWKPPASCANFSPNTYFANNYLACSGTAAALAGGPGLNSAISAANSACVAALDQCIAPKNRGDVASTCAAMGASLANVAGQVTDGMKAAADAYNAAGPAAFVSAAYTASASGAYRDFCSTDFWDFQTTSNYVNQCAAFVSRQFPTTVAACPAGPLSPVGVNAAATVCAHSFSSALVVGGAAQQLVGPDSAYCKLQKANASPCKVTTKMVGGVAVPVPVSVDCGNYLPHGPFIPSPFRPKPDAPVANFNPANLPRFDPLLPATKPGDGGSNGVNSATNTSAGQPTIGGAGSNPNQPNLIPNPFPNGGGHGPALPSKQVGLPLGDPNPPKPPATGNCTNPNGCGHGDVFYVNSDTNSPSPAGKPITVPRFNPLTPTKKTVPKQRTTVISPTGVTPSQFGKPVQHPNQTIQPFRPSSGSGGSNSAMDRLSGSGTPIQTGKASGSSNSRNKFGNVTSTFNKTILTKPDTPVDYGGCGTCRVTPSTPTPTINPK